MKRFGILFITIILFACSDLKRTVLTESQLQELQITYKNKRYFDLRDVLQKYNGLLSVMMSYYRGMADNKFNRLESSIEHLRTFIRHAALRNVIFLVFDDKDLYFKQADYQIIGAIGFPAASSLKEMTFHQMDALSIPAAPRAFPHQNLCLDCLTPVIAGFYKGRRFAFCLDTGAGQSVLYIPFFREYEGELKAQYPLQSNRQQGLGGHRDIPAYIMKEVVLSFAGKEAFFQNLPVLTDVTTDGSHYFFGNIGRNLLHQFNTMILNFESMFVKFE